MYVSCDSLLGHPAVKSPQISRSLSTPRWFFHFTGEIAGGAAKSRVGRSMWSGIPRTRSLEHVCGRSCRPHSWGRPALCTGGDQVTSDNIRSEVTLTISVEPAKYMDKTGTKIDGLGDEAYDEGEYAGAATSSAAGPASVPMRTSSTRSSEP